MKTSYLNIILLSAFMSSCKQNADTGELEPSWVFWVFLGLILLGLLFGVISNSVRSKNKTPDGQPGKTEREIEEYRETLEKKEEENEKK